MMCRACIPRQYLGPAVAFMLIVLASPSRAEVVRTGYTAVVAASTGKCLDITGASSTAGAAAIQWRCNFAPNQQWTVQPFNSAYRVVEQQSGQCLSVAGASTTAGAAIVQNP